MNNKENLFGHLIDFVDELFACSGRRVRDEFEVEIKLCPRDLLTLNQAFMDYSAHCGFVGCDEVSTRDPAQGTTYSIGGGTLILSPSQTP